MYLSMMQNPTYIQTLPEIVPRDLERIIGIHTPLDVWAETTVTYYPLRRTYRRDFHIVSIYVFMSRGEVTRKLSQTIQSLETMIFQERRALKKLDLGENTFQFSPCRINLRIISPLTLRYYNCIRAVDSIAIELMQAEFKTLITDKKRKEIMRDLFALLGEIKSIALNLPEPKKANQARR